MPTERLSAALSSITRPKLVLRPIRTREHPPPHGRAQEMRGLIDRGHRPIAVPGRRTGEHHRGVGKHHQRLGA